MSEKVADGSENGHDTQRTFGNCCNSIKGARRDTRQDLLEASSSDWGNSLEGYSTAYALQKDLSDWSNT